MLMPRVRLQPSSAILEREIEPRAPASADPRRAQRKRTGAAFVAGKAFTRPSFDARGPLPLPPRAACARWRSRFCYRLLVALLCAPGRSDDPYAAARELSRRMCETMRVVADVPGFSVSVAADGRIVFSEGFGWADLEQRVPVTPRTRFRTGSIAKPISAAAVAWLHERGQIDIDAPLHRYLPDLPEHVREITVRQLAGHLSGVRHYNAADPRDALHGEHFGAARDTLKRFINDPLVDEPGAGRRYTTYGYVLLSAAAEGATQRDFGPLLEDTILRPLGLRGTAVVDPANMMSDRTSFYQRDAQGRITNAPYADMSYKIAGGGLLSTSDDLVTFATALMQPGFFKQETLDLLFTSMTTAAGKPTGYGFGWDVRADESGRRTFGHNGGQLGCRTALVAYPEQRVAVAIMNNMGGAPIGEHEARIIANLFIHARDGQPPAPVELDLEGVHDLTFTLRGDEYRGWLALSGRGWAARGEAVAACEGEPTLRATLAGAFSEGDAVRLVLMHAQHGAGVLRLKGDRDALEGDFYAAPDYGAASLRRRP